MNAAQAEEEVEKIMKSVDRDNSGHIDYTGQSFFNIALLYSTHHKRFKYQNSSLPLSIEKIFCLSKDWKPCSICSIRYYSDINPIKRINLRNFIKDGSGSVSIAELKEIFGGKDVSEDVWKELLKEVDDNGDGEVNDFYYFTNGFLINFIHSFHIRNSKI